MTLNEIKQRVLYGWTFMRVLYLVMGVTIIIQASMASQWVGMMLGVYFASMGIFSFGCAGGNCTYTPPRQEQVIKESTRED